VKKGSLMAPFFMNEIMIIIPRESETKGIADINWPMDEQRPQVRQNRRFFHRDVGQADLRIAMGILVSIR
jgi:hypothetical protein